MKSRQFVVVFVVLASVFGVAASSNVPLGNPWTYGSVTLDDNGITVDDQTYGLDQGIMLSRGGNVQAVFSVEPIETILLSKAIEGQSPFFHILAQYKDGNDATVEIGAQRDTSPLESVRMRFNSGPNPYIMINPDLTSVDTSIYGTNPNPVLEVVASDNSVNIDGELVVDGNVTVTGVLTSPTGPSHLTISEDGEIDVENKNWVKIDTYAGATKDELCMINGGVPGQEIVISTLSSARDVVVLNRAPCNIAAPKKVTYTHIFDRGVYQFDGVRWIPLTPFADNK